MPDKTFSLEVTTPEKVIYSEEVTTLKAHGGEGYLGILPQHAPLITTIVPGPLNITGPDGKNITFTLSNGFMEVRDNKVVILADSAENE